MRMLVHDMCEKEVHWCPLGLTLGGCLLRVRDLVGQWSHFPCLADMLLVVHLVGYLGLFHRWGLQSLLLELTAWVG